MVPLGVVQCVTHMAIWYSPGDNGLMNLKASVYISSLSGSQQWLNYTLKTCKHFPRYLLDNRYFSSDGRNNDSDRLCALPGWSVVESSLLIVTPYLHVTSSLGTFKEWPQSCFYLFVFFVIYLEQVIALEGCTQVWALLVWGRIQGKSYCFPFVISLYHLHCDWCTDKTSLKYTPQPNLKNKGVGVEARTGSTTSLPFR